MNVSFEGIQKCLNCEGRFLCKSKMARKAKSMEVAFSRKMIEDNLFFESKHEINKAFNSFVEKSIIEEV